MYPRRFPHVDQDATLTTTLRRFVDDAFGFALTWNYWFNDAVSTASDLVALQLLLQYWTDNFPGWALSLIFLFVLLALNLVSVKIYGEAEYWLSFLKIVTIVIFIILGQSFAENSYTVLQQFVSVASILRTLTWGVQASPSMSEATRRESTSEAATGTSATLPSSAA